MKSEVYFNFKLLLNIFWGKKHIESTILCYSLAKHARFCKPGVVTFSRRYIFNFSVGELVENNWGNLVGFSSVKNVDFIQCNLKSDSIFRYY